VTKVKDTVLALQEVGGGVLVPLVPPLHDGYDHSQDDIEHC